MPSSAISLSKNDSGNENSGLHLRFNHKAPATSSSVKEPSYEEDHHQTSRSETTTTFSVTETQDHEMNENTPRPTYQEDLQYNKENSYGKTVDGIVFRIPETHNMISSLFDPRLPKSHLDLLTLITLICQLIPLCFFSRSRLIKFYLVCFLFWRLMYNAGLGWLLKRQSERRFLVRLVSVLGIFDPQTHPRLSKWFEDQLQAKMSTNDRRKTYQTFTRRETQKKQSSHDGYDFRSVPLDFNVWLLFRQVVDVILLNDFLSYLLLSICSLSLPRFEQQYAMVRYLSRWTAGIILLGFNIWVKIDAHRIVHDFAWYWGDAFFLSLRELVFDGVFEMAPHPMYSIGYAGFYGASLITGSRTVFFTSLLAHLSQFGFLIYFENPHIERVYGPQAKPLTVQRQPSTGARSRSRSKQPANHLKMNTPASSEADSASVSNTHENPVTNEKDVHISKAERRQELDHRLFRKDLILLSNFDRYRAMDFSTVISLLYSSLFLFIPNRYLSLINAIGWRIWFSFGLGLRLRSQSTSKSLVVHFFTHYPYFGVPDKNREEELIDETFHNWKSIYNLSLMMTYVSFAIMSIKFYRIDQDWDITSELVRHTFGLCLIGIHVWTAKSAFEVLGKFGWFYGDFFIDDYPIELSYAGIYRFLNNPERSMGGAGFIGMSLMSGDKLVIGIALGSILSHWWFLSKVESPHMKKVYGDRIRKEAGLTKVLKQNAQRLKHNSMRNRAASDHYPQQSRFELSDGRSLSLGVDMVNGNGMAEEREHQSGKRGLEQKFKEVQGTFEFIYEEAVEALDEFLEKSAPRLSGVVRDTKVLLQRSGERLILTRVANDLSSYDTSQYKLNISESVYHPSRDPATNRLKFHMGEPIRLNWVAPPNHSRADWIGCYRKGANRSGLLSEVTSQGRWCGLFEEHWDGDMYIGEVQNLHDHTNLETDRENVGGLVEFRGERLPWKEGEYEFRFHHDGKHNVMAITEPFIIYVEKMDSVQVSHIKEVETKLRNLVGYGLGLQKNLIPKKLLKEIEILEKGSGFREPLLDKLRFEDEDEDEDEKQEEEDDDDRFTVMSLEEAKRIKKLIEIGIGIELGIEILIEDGKIKTLAQRIMFVKSLLKPLPSS